MSDGMITFDPRGGEADVMMQRIAWQQLGLAMRTLAVIDLDAIRQSIELGDSVGPFLDPTAYMNANHDDRRDTAELCRLLAPAVEHWRSKIDPKLGDPS